MLKLLNVKAQMFPLIRFSQKKRDLEKRSYKGKKKYIKKNPNLGNKKSALKNICFK